ncbi:MAG: BlaI/MecI/CopY family transcriptional regulator [bacterium]|nr:BlaI/MecI/CopY family transcriptional regulator [bacterium]
MAKTPKPRVVRSSGTPRDRVSSGEWPVLRACWRLGEEAPTAEIVREVQKDRIFSYRHIQSVLLRLVDKGYLRVEKRGPRRNVWTSTLDPAEVLEQEVRVFVNEVVGLEPGNIQLIHDVLDELLTHGPYVAFDEAGLPRELRVRLIALVDGFIDRKRDRWALAAALGLKPKALDQSPTLAGAISLVMAAGGDTISAAVKLLDAIEELLEEDEAEKASEISELRDQLLDLP